MRPVEGFGDQRNGSRATPAEQDRRNRDARRIVPFGSDDRALGGGGGEPGIWVGGGFRRAGSPVASLPVGQVGGRRIGEVLPPHVAVIGERDICEDAVAPQRRDRVGVRDFTGSGCDTEESRLGIDRVKPTVLAESHPRDIVPYGLNPPSRNGGLEHSKIGLPTCGREGRRQVFRIAARRRDLEDEHVLRQPSLIAGHHRCHAQRVAFLTEQGVTAISGTVGPDLPRLGEMRDVFGRAARPRHISLARLQRSTDGMHCADERAALLDKPQRWCPHSRHDSHRYRHVGRVGYLDTEL